MMKCRGMGAAMRKMGGGSMKPVAMRKGKMVKRKQMGYEIPIESPKPPVPPSNPPITKPVVPPIRQVAPRATPTRRAAKEAASSARKSGAMSDRRAYGKMIKRKMKGKSC